MKVLEFLSVCRYVGTSDYRRILLVQHSWDQIRCQIIIYSRLSNSTYTDISSYRYFVVSFHISGLHN